MNEEDIRQAILNNLNINVETDKNDEGTLLLRVYIKWGDTMIDSCNTRIEP